MTARQAQKAPGGKTERQPDQMKGALEKGGPAKSDSGVPPEQMDYLFADPPAADSRLPSAPVADSPTADSTGSAAPNLPVAVGRRVGEALVRSRLDGMGDADVRAALARKLCRLLPDLPPDGRDKAAAVALRALEQLARDHTTRVREALATAIKDIACAPPSVARQLAQDVERSVAEPILHYCATLTDEDLLAVLARDPAGWAVSAIAARSRVSAPVSDAIVETGQTEATGVLLDNTGAVIPENTLERLVDQAARHRDWQAKLATRPALPRRLALRLAEFVDGSVVEALRRRPDFDEATVADIAAATRRRVAWIETLDPADPPERRAVRMHRDGTLDEAAIGDALSWNEVAFVRAALALRSAVPPATTEAILESGDARAVTALVWRAGYSMRCAMQVQARVSNIPPRAMLNARQGTAYPITAADMTRHLARYGVRG